MATVVCRSSEVREEQETRMPFWWDDVQKYNVEATRCQSNWYIETIVEKDMVKNRERHKGNLIQEMARMYKQTYKNVQNSRPPRRFFLQETITNLDLIDKIRVSNPVMSPFPPSQLTDHFHGFSYPLTCQPQSYLPLLCSWT